MRSYLEAKAMAKSLRDSMAARDVSLSHSDCLEIVARQFGFRDWNTLSSKIELDTGARTLPPEAAEIALQPAIPVVRVRSSREAEQFYVDYLGFSFDWGRGRDDRRLYAQVSRSGVTLHLSGYDGGNGSIGSEVLIRMTGLESLHAELTGKRSDLAAPKIHHTPDDRLELHVTDPFGNTLRFSQNNPPGVANAVAGA